MPFDLGIDPGADPGLDPVVDEPEVKTPAKNWKAHESEIIRAIRDQLGHPGDDQRGEVSLVGPKVVSTYGSSDLGYQIKGSFRAKFPVQGPGPYWFVANISPDDTLMFPVITTANDGNPIREAQVKQVKTAATDVPHLFAATVKPLENLYRFWTAVLKEAKSHESDSSTSVCISSEPGEYSMFSADWMERGLQQTIEMFHGLLTLWKSSTAAVKAMPVAYAYYNQLAGIREAVVDLSEHALDHQVGFFCIDQRGVRALLTLITQARRDAMDLAKYLPLKMAPRRKQAAVSPWRRLS